MRQNYHRLKGVSLVGHLAWVSPSSLPSSSFSWFICVATRSALSQFVDLLLLFLPMVAADEEQEEEEGDSSPTPNRLVFVCEAAFLSHGGDRHGDDWQRMARWNKSSRALAAAWLGVSSGTWPLFLQLMLRQFWSEQPSSSW